jgi:Calpain family cysteine protease/Ubiquitin interaction motif
VKGEWKGAFSDKSSIWEKLLVHSGVSLPRTNANDGTFWIGYDDFLMGFSNVDIVLAFQGNHAKSFSTNFAPKKSNHRCVRAFEVSLIDPQPGIETKEQVEVYVMGIQKNRRGARQGRSDRKKSYKLSDMGMLVGEYPLDAPCDDPDDHAHSDSLQFTTVHGQMFGFQRNGHYRLMLDRQKCKRMAVMPISFGHPAATDKSLSFVVRFNADSPLMIRELPTVPRIDRLFRDFLFQPKPPGHFERTRQGQQEILLETTHYRIVQINCLGNSGGAFFVYLCAAPSAGVSPISFRVEARCRGMSCRTVDGLLEHATIAKGKIFEASWRQYQASFANESKSRLLMVLYQSGQDTEMGSVTCTGISTEQHRPESTVSKVQPKPAKETTLEKYWTTAKNYDKSVATSCTASHEDLAYSLEGIFHQVSMDHTLFSSCGSNDHLSDFSSMPFENHQQQLSLVADADLQRAIELSRIESIGAYEGYPISMDNVLGDNRPPESMATGGGSYASIRDDNWSAKHETLLFDEEYNLNRAIELSMMDERLPAHRDKKWHNAPSDDEKDFVRKERTDYDREVVVLDDAGTDEHPMDSIRSKAAGILAGPTKCGTGEMTNENNDTIVLDLTDPGCIPSLPATGARQPLADLTTSNADRVSAQKQKKQEAVMTTLEIDKAAKRMLAADAALKRLEGR